jgi:hypothetical protein
VTPVLAQRQLALAGVALVATLVALAVSSPGSSRPKAPLPRPVAVEGSGWYRALAAPGGGTPGHRSACGTLLSATTVGVAHPVLPCGAKIFISFGAKQVLTQIVDHGPRTPGVEFEILPALAKKLDLHGVQPIRWTFARS